MMGIQGVYGQQQHVAVSLFINGQNIASGTIIIPVCTNITISMTATNLTGNPTSLTQGYICLPLQPFTSIVYISRPPITTVSNAYCFGSSYSFLPYTLPPNGSITMTWTAFAGTTTPVTLFSYGLAGNGTTLNRVGYYQVVQPCTGNWVVGTTCAANNTITSAIAGGMLPSATPTSVGGSGVTLVINGTLTINTNYTILAGTNVKMGPNAKIIVPAGKILTIGDAITTTNISACANVMWDEITLSPSATLGGRLNMYKTNIRDAKHAIHAKKNAQLEVQNCDINTNYVGLWVQDAAAAVGSGLALFNFKNNTLQNQSFPLLPPYNGTPIGQAEAGILVEGMDLSLTGSYATRNTFRYLKHGIKAVNSNVSLDQSCVFNNMNYGIKAETPISASPKNLIYNGFGKWGNIAFQTCLWGISTQRMNVEWRNTNIAGCFYGLNSSLSPNCSNQVISNRLNCINNACSFSQNDPIDLLDVKDNEIEIIGAASGFGAVGYGGIAITEALNAPNGNSMVNWNKIYVNKGNYGITVNSAINTQIFNNQIFFNDYVNNITGIFVSNCKGNNVRCNQIIQSALPTFGTAMGIQVQNCQTYIGGGISFPPTYSCNYMTQTRKGMQFESTCLGSVIKGNTMSNHLLGLYYTASANTGPQPMRGNVWAGTYSAASGRWGAYHLGNAFQANQSLYTVPNAASGPQYWAGGSVPPAPPIWGPYIVPNGFTKWFQTGIGIVYNCGWGVQYACPIPIPIIQDTLNSTDALIANPTTIGVPYELEMQWQADRYLYAKLNNDSTLLQDSLMLAFYQAEREGSAAAYQEMEEARANALHFSPVDKQLLIGFENQLKTIADSTHCVDSLLLLNDTDSLLLAQKASLSQLHSQVQSQYDAVWVGLEAINHNRITFLQGENDLLPNTEVYEANEQAVNDIYFSTVARGNMDFSEEQITELYSIANQCPLSGGEAVYLARSLYRSIDNTAVYDDQSLCYAAGVQYREGNPADIASSEPSFKLYPNPATDVVNVVWYNLAEGIGKLEIKDAMGRTVFAENIDFQQTEQIISLANMQAGVYFVSVYQANEILKTEKLIIIK